jgi:glycosyltransferase involved in cell wall biosynthesis
MPRVLQVVLSLNPGGTERLVLELVKRLHPTIPTQVCCLDEGGAWASELENQGIHVVSLQRRPGFRPALSQAIANLVRGHRASVVHAHHYSPFVYAALARLWLPRTRVVFTEHGRLSDAPPSRKRHAANQILTRLSAATFAVSADLRTHLVSEGFPPRSVEVIYNGIDVGTLPTAEERRLARGELGVSKDAIVIGTIARLDPVKSLNTLIRAVALLGRTAPASLLIVGDGPERQGLEAVAAAADVSSAVRFLGHRDDARRWLGACDIFANSSISEGVSLTILEAMAAGLPVVATRVGGTPEVIDETCGRLVPARSVEALAAALGELAVAPALRQDLGRAARARVEERFTLERMVEAYRVVYERLG